MRAHASTVLHERLKRTPDRRDPDDRIPPNTRQIHGSHTHIQQTVMFELQFVQIMTVTRARRGSAGGSVQIAGDSGASWPPRQCNSGVCGPPTTLHYPLRLAKFSIRITNANSRDLKWT